MKSRFFLFKCLSLLVLAFALSVSLASCEPDNPSSDDNNLLGGFLSPLIGLTVSPEKPAVGQSIVISYTERVTSTVSISVTNTKGESFFSDEDVTFPVTISKGLPAAGRYQIRTTIGGKEYGNDLIVY